MKGLAWRREVSMFLVVAGFCCLIASQKIAADQTNETPVTTSPVEKRKPNRLIHEKSPYLLQHAYNPVDWYPWGEEAFAKARAENKPIFLSIGYSTCHWCHVMEHESFENDAIAAVMNQYFVSIKVDREERPDIDKVYMTAVQATTGSGGWPMSVFLTPDLKPFYCGTYFPPDARYGRPGFKELLERVHELWESNRTGIVAQADQIAGAVAQAAALSGVGAGRLDEAPLRLGLEQLGASYDEVNGGFGGAPKFPRPVTLNFLFREYARTGGVHARDMALHTLWAMAEGGMFDQLGGGFHRYSVDDRWLVSHFEKMLYDQAQLIGSYIDAWQITHDPFFAGTARRTCDYVLRDMTSPEGGFYSAEDADSEGEEGKFYVWTRGEIDAVIGDKDSRGIICKYYGVESGGNWENGKNVLHVATTVEETARVFHRSESDVRAVLDEGRQKLFVAREKRVRPHRDDKVLTAWNGLMISALARAAQALDEPRYKQAAEKAAAWILAHRDQGKRLMRTETVPAMAEDHAFLATGLLDLYETDFDPRWLRAAVELSDAMLDSFYDKENGGFFQTDGRDASVIVRSKEDYDGAEPSGNSMATLVLLRLAEFTDNGRYREAAEKTLGLFGRRLGQAPSVAPQMLCALDFDLSKPRQIVIAGKPDAADTRALLRAVYDRYLPNKILLLADGGPAQESLAKLMPFIADMKPVNGKAAAFVCVNYACQLPVTDAKELEKQLQ